MKQCEFCGANLPDDAGFCGNCGNISYQASDQATHMGNMPTAQLRNDSNENSPTMAMSGDVFNYPATGPQRPLKLGPTEEEEEEKRRRAALLGLGLPLLADQAFPAHVPTVQGTPYMSHIPTMQGTPPMQGGMPPSAPAQPPMTFPKHHGHHPHHPSKPPKTSTGGTSGCLTVSLIIIAAVVIILASVIGLGLTVWTPGLSLGGSSTVTPGGTLTLNGSHFLPSSSVTLTLDSGIPLLFAQRAVPMRQAYAHAQQLASSAQNAANVGHVLDAFLAPPTTNVIGVGGDGSFAVTITADPAWTLGSHVVHATESLSHRIASLPFTIGTPPTATATSTPTATPTPAPTATPTPPTLSCAVPGLLNLGPVSELSSQVATGNVTLCASGTGTLTWNASWDQNQAPWLQLNQATGTIQAPNEAAVTVNASPANLSAGNYITTITFTGQESNTTQTVTVKLAVQTGCINATPPELDFTGVEKTSDPQSSQNITITNCGLTSNWFTKTVNNSSWLSLNPGRGTLNNGATATIAVTASNLKAKLKASRLPYRDTIVITLGSQTISVLVTLTVQPAPVPVLSASPNPVDPFGTGTTCTREVGTNNDLCTVILTNSSSPLDLVWSWSSTTTGVSVQPNSGTIAAGGTELVTLVVPHNDCQNGVTFTFTGPGNAVNVIWNCNNG